MLDKFKRVLVLAPHTDDGELGAGGTIAKLLDLNADVFYAAFSTAEESVPDHMPKDILKTEVQVATAELGIKSENILLFNFEVRKLNYKRQEILENMIQLRSEIDPDLILMPSMQDIHQDHSTVAFEALRAFKSRTLLGYELIWNNLSFSTDCFVSIEQSHLNRKIRALAQYKSQEGRDYMSAEFIRSLAKTRGVQIGYPLAESFEVLRWVLN